MLYLEDDVSEIIDRDKMEELLFSIQNAAHTEYHLLEVHEKNYTKGDLTSYIEQARDIRRVLMNELMNMFNDNGVGAIWCVIKHALLTHFHLLELYEKNYEKVYIEQAQKVYLLINDLLKHKYENYNNCSRCDGDKKEQQDSHQMELLIEPHNVLSNSKTYLTEHDNTCMTDTTFKDFIFVVD